LNHARLRLVQVLQQSFASFAARFSEWRRRTFLHCKAVFDRASAEAATVEFEDAQGFLRSVMSLAAAPLSSYFYDLQVVGRIATGRAVR
jgi:hypothetical protein